MDKQTTWIQDLLNAAQENPTPEIRHLIECCGKGCAINNGSMETVNSLWKAASACQTQADYVAFMREHIPIRIDEAEDGIILHLGKEKCTCPMAEEVTSPMLCNCTLGHEKAIWSIVFGCPIDAEIVESFQRGGSDCVIKLKIPFKM